MNHLTRVLLVMIAFTFGMIEPLFPSPLSPMTTKNSHRQLNSISSAHHPASPFSETERVRTPNSVWDETPRFGDVEMMKHLGAITKSQSIAGSNRQSFQPYRLMDQSASSPGRWRC